MQLFVGVDGGGTTTRVIVYAAGSRQAIMVDGEPTRISLVGLARARDCIVDLLRQGIATVGGDMAEVVAMSACLSGVDTNRQADAMRHELRRYFPNVALEVTNDAFAALSAGILGRVGVAVIGGTGSIAVGERADGAVARAGGYGSLVGDEGSAFDIGRQGIAAAIRAFEGRGPETMLWRQVAAHFGVDHPIELVNSLYEDGKSVSTVAGFAGKVLEIAEEDGVAGAIVSGAVEAYAQLVYAVRRLLADKLGGRVVLAGGIFEAYRFMQDKLQIYLPCDTLVTLNRPPAFGALMRAIELAKARHSRLGEVSALSRSHLESLVIRSITSSGIAGG
ncbi:N-acetylglucosamine kinase [Alicyclobacillus shizuokensis]|uniref:N-acetylglucosamine kinase n=1 Tax=Alicyclobacillus shizuokensis TaxID=392014 RepID=UPI00082B7A43|nr:BadF/BadG/BcrA/BcrD ATPase family protein [Alicyclobacillus shizuokensis]MCL6625263.1 hypothetical protein [Alicyclobacillus shizuokensis]